MKLFRISAILLFVLTVYTNVYASTITFGQSWDGNPPGTLSDITNLTGFSDNTPAFTAGTYTAAIDGGFSAWFAQDTVAVSSGPTLVPFHSLTFVTTSPWVFVANTPDLLNATSLGQQFAIKQTSPTTWVWGLEDIALPFSDHDFQDLYGTLTLIPTNADPRSTPTVPEPMSLVLVGGALLVGAKFTRRR